jgi:heat shock protein HslJ
MKVLYITCISLLALAVLATGCTSQPVQTPATPAATTALTTPPPVTPSSPTLSSTTWTLAWFSGEQNIWSKVAEGSTITATFLNEGKVTGSGGCNGYSSDFQLGNESRIWFRRPVVPQNNLCQTPVGVMSQESYFFTDLQNAETYSITNNQLIMFDRDGKKILQFDPSP